MTVHLDLPDDLHRLAAAYAERGGLPIEGFLTQAVTMALAGLEVRGDGGLAYLRERAAQADHEKALAVLDATPDVPPDPWDAWDEDGSEVPAPKALP